MSYQQAPIRYSWIKAIDRMPDDPAVHQYMLAYASDFGLILTSLYPHGHSFWDPDMQVASLDHAMWFHRPFRADRWLSFVQESPVAAGGRGFARGEFFSQDGTLVASALVAYGFARFRFPFKNFLFVVLMSTIILPPAVTLVPTYAFFVSIMDWGGTWLPLIVPQMFVRR